MSTILAAIDDSTAAAPVLSVASAMASLLGGAVDALHVREGDKTTAEAVAERGDIALRVVDGDPVAEIVRAAADPEVRLVAVGTRGQPAGPRPAGHIALAVIEQIHKPIVAVPPDAVPPDAAHPIRRALIPLEGTPASSDAVAGTLGDLAAAGVELVGVHVFSAATVPAFWDEPGHAEQSWASEFLSRWCTHAGVDLHLRRGAPPQTVVEIADTEKVDLIALGWSQDLSAGRAEVVRAVLAHACVPVLLLPLAGPPHARLGRSTLARPAGT